MEAIAGAIMFACICVLLFFVLKWAKKIDEARVQQHQRLVDAVEEIAYLHKK